MEDGTAIPPDRENTGTDSFPENRLSIGAADQGQTVLPGESQRFFPQLSLVGIPRKEADQICAGLRFSEILQIPVNQFTGLKPHDEDETLLRHFFCPRQNL